MNDIWYSGGGHWVVYVDDRELIKDFSTIRGMKNAAKYFGSRVMPLAVQFSFYQDDNPLPGNCLLHYVCVRAHFNFRRALSLSLMAPGTSYRKVYPMDVYQQEFFMDYEPPRIKGRKKKGKGMV